MTEHKQLLKAAPSLVLDEIKPDEHWVFGGTTGIVGVPLVPDGNWLPYLPKGEVQKNDSIETYDCTGFGCTNRLEIIWKRIFGTERNFSDRGVGIVAGTKPPGNSPQTVAEAVRKSGLLDEADLPFDDSVKTVEQFYSPSPLTTPLKNKANEFLSFREPLHDWVATDIASLKEALKFSPLMVTVTAWFRDENGFYYFPDGMVNNHDTTLVKIEDDGSFTIFDSYPDETGSYIKKLRKDCKFQLSKRYWLGPGVLRKNQIIEALINLWKQLLATIIAPPPVPFPSEVATSTPVAPVAPAPLPTPQPNQKSKIELWAEAIKSREGFFAPGQNPNYPNGTPAWANNNPGNFRYTPFAKNFLGAVAMSAGGYAIFPTYLAGWLALINFLAMCCQNKVKGYHDVTLLQFFMDYAPKEDKNDPVSYANEVAKKVGVPVDTPIKQLLS